MKVKKKAKGAGKGKKKDLSPEDKLRLLAAEEEERRLKAEALRRKLKEKKELEDIFTRVNGKKLEVQWRQLLRHEKLVQLRKEVGIIAQSYEREFDRKNALCQMLAADVEEAEEQYMNAQRSHLQNCDALFELYNALVDGAETEYTGDLNELTDEFSKEKEYVRNCHNTDKKNIISILDATEKENNDLDAEINQDHESAREEIKNKNSEDYNILRLTLEASIEDLEHHIETVHSAYITNTEKRTEQFKILTTKDLQSAKTIETQIRKLTRLQESIAKYKAKIQSNVAECEERNRGLKEEKEEITKHYHGLKGKMVRLRNAEQSRLTSLSKASHVCLKELKEKANLAERIIRMSELNRKMESEREKVEAFQKTAIEREIDEEAKLVDDEGGSEAEGYASRSSTEVGTYSRSGSQMDGLANTGEHNLKPSADMHSSAIARDGGAIRDWEHLNSFYKRLNKATLEKIALEKERNELKEEHQTLVSLVQQYLDGVSVTDQVLSKPNPLVVVNDKVNVAHPPMAEVAQVTAVDAGANLRSSVRQHTGRPAQAAMPAMGYNKC